METGLWRTPSGWYSTPNRTSAPIICRNDEFQRRVTSSPNRFCTSVIVMYTVKVSPMFAMFADGSTSTVVSGDALANAIWVMMSSCINVVPKRIFLDVSKVNLNENSPLCLCFLKFSRSPLSTLLPSLFPFFLF